MNKMILGIIGFILISFGLFIGIKKGIKKYNKDKLKEIKELDKEFEEGKILIPIDKRDFENLEDFKEKTSHIKKISDQLETIDKDFKKVKFEYN